MMWLLNAFQALCLQVALINSAAVTKKPQYQRLPPLRQQAAIEDAWKQERIDNVPKILNKHGVDAWLVRLTNHSLLKNVKKY